VVKTFGDFEFDDRRRCLRARGQPVRLSGQAIDLLCLLLERPGELITREEIEHRLWPETNVNFHHSLDVVVSRLRTVLGDRGQSPRFIETVPRRGYRFIEPVTARPEARSANAPRLGGAVSSLTWVSQFLQRSWRSSLREHGMTSLSRSRSVWNHHRRYLPDNGKFSFSSVE
jgi:DNA-binding winged helix-turn-helix (wHTH) protein